MDATVRAMEKMRQEQARQQQLLKQTASVSSSSRRKAKTKRGAATFKDSFVGEVNRLKNLDNLTRLDQAKRRMLEDDDSDDSDDERGGGAGGGAGRNDEEKDEAVGSEGGSQQRSKSKKREKSKKSSISASDDPLRVIPEEYRLHGMDTEPLLYYLRLLPEDSSLTALLEAAQKDIRLHQARIKAAAANNHLLLEEYDFSKDPSWVDRQAKHKSRMEHMVQLQQDRGVILKDLVEDTTESKKNKNLTPEEKNQVKLARWQRALELYVYCPTDMDMDLLGLLEKLLEGTSEVCTFFSIVAFALSFGLRIGLQNGVVLCCVCSILGRRIVRGVGSGCSNVQRSGRCDAAHGARRYRGRGRGGGCLRDSVGGSFALRPKLVATGGGDSLQFPHQWPCRSRDWSPARVCRIETRPMRGRIDSDSSLVDDGTAGRIRTRVGGAPQGQ